MSAPNLGTIPLELVQLIFGHARWCCTRGDLARIALTSSYLNTVITPALYATVIADEEQILFAVRATLARDPSKGKYVRNLVLPRHVSFAARIAGSVERRALHDSQRDVLLACPHLVSLEINPLSESLLDAGPWGAIRRLSLASDRVSIYKAAFARCANIRHLNLFDLRGLVSAAHFFNAVFFGRRAADGGHAPPVHRFDALRLVSAEWADPAEQRAVEFVRLFCALPSTRRVLLLLSTDSGFASVAGTRTWELMRPLEDTKVHVALYPRVHDVWALACDQKEDYAEIGEQVWSDV